MQTVMTGIRLGGCPGLSEYSLDEQVILFDLSCSSSFIFHNGKNVQVNCKVCPQYISYCKIPIFSDDFRHILSYKRALRVTIALKW